MQGNPIKGKQKEQMLKRSIFAILTRFLSSRLHCALDHSVFSGDFMPLCNEMTAKVQAFLQHSDHE